MKHGIPLLHPALLSVLAAGGILIGRQLHSAPPASGGTESATDIPAPVRPGRPTAAASPSPAHDLAGLRRLRENQSKGEFPESLALARIPTPALKEMILAQHAFLSAAVPSRELMAHWDLIGLAAVELYRRDDAATHEWASAIPSEILREYLLRAIITGAAKDQPLLAKTWLDTYQSTEKDYLRRVVGENVLKGALERGDPAEALRLIALFDLKEPSFHGVTYPDGFDFAGLFTTLSGKANLSAPLYQWAIRNPDAAWAATRNRLQDKSLGPDSHGGPFPSIFNAHLLRDGTELGTAWATARLAELPPSDRAACLADIATSARSISVGAVAALAGALPPADRKILASALTKNIHERDKAFAVMEVIPRGDMLRQLATVYDGNRRTLEPDPPDPGEDPLPDYAIQQLNRLRLFFTDAEKRFSLTPEEVTRMKAVPEK
ncbi:hypothetical protein OVA24_07275 [Luteolibacter sp. SL250]|uniref:hypothetical protein n=1 Tax=Luteolibacter sp. SL250 TaxID=2995170 RepID=UPI00226F3983|nr:hypothetical protein [Luteolibacter sp. SL250]WAC21183.1 hypothetical protein OVA24_07275 [Luteolibacter sp. SL250]